MLQSLEDLCIDSIVKRFYFYNAFFSTEDVGWKRRLEFLRRKYSMELITRLTAREDSIHRYIDFLLNNYIKVLDTTWFRNCSWEKVTAKIAEIGPKIEKFRCAAEETDFPPWLDVLCYFPNLKCFASHFSNDDLLINIANFCPFIAEIDIYYSLITSRGIQSLCKNQNGDALCTNLKKICINMTYGVTKDDILNLLQNLPLLEIIDIANFSIAELLYNFHIKDLLSLDKVKPYNITKLDFFYNNPEHIDTWKLCSSLCPRVKTIRCRFSNEDELKFISNFSDLEDLDIGYYAPRKELLNIDEFLKTNGNKLISLKMTYFSLSISILAENCLQLENLCLERVDFLLDRDVKPVFKFLTSLKFYDCDRYGNDKIISLLSATPKLELLLLRAVNDLSPEMEDAILKCCEFCPMKKIFFSCDDITHNFVRDLLLNCRTLRHLEVKVISDDNDVEKLRSVADSLPNQPTFKFTAYLPPRKSPFVPTYLLE